MRDSGNEIERVGPRTSRNIPVAGEDLDAGKARRRRRLFVYAGTGAAALVAIVLIGYSLRQESAEGRDEPDTDTAVAAAPPGPSGQGRADEGPAVTPRAGTRRGAGSAAPGGTPAPANAGGQAPAPGSAEATAGPAPAAASTAASPDGGAPADEASARGASRGALALGASAAPVDAGAPPAGAAASGSSRAALAAKTRAASASRVAQRPDGGASALDARPSNVSGAGRGPLAQAGAAEQQAATDAVRDGGVAETSRASALRVRPVTYGVAMATPRPTDVAGAAAAPGRAAEGNPPPPTALERRFAALERSRKDEELALRPVERFVPTGGVTLTGRVVDAETGKAIAGSDVHVHHEGTLVEGMTDATGSFKLPGMVAGSRVVVWVGRTGDAYIDERLELAVPGVGEAADVGTLKLLRGDELSARSEGWVGLFIDRHRGQIVVAGVSPWTPADTAHLEVGDQLVSVNGRDLQGLGPRAVAYLLRGRVGTSVALVIRERDGERRKLTLARAVR